MRRERFADEAADVASTQAGSQDSVFSHGEMIVMLFNVFSHGEMVIMLFNVSLFVYLYDDCCLEL